MTDPAIRDEGLYWVNRTGARGKSGWDIARFQSGRWYFFGDEHAYGGTATPMISEVGQKVAAFEAERAKRAALADAEPSAESVVEHLRTQVSGSLQWTSKDMDKLITALDTFRTAGVAADRVRWAAILRKYDKNQDLGCPEMWKEFCQ